MRQKDDLPLEYALSLIRLVKASTELAAPGLLLYSRSLTWPFGPQQRPLTDAADLRPLADAAGLHPVDDPFAGTLPDAAEPWMFHLPTPARPAMIDTPGIQIRLARTPDVTREWWSLAVAAGGRCRMLIAACVAFPSEATDTGTATDAGTAILEAATNHRVYGATISVEF